MLMLFGYLVILVAYSIFLVIAYKQPRMGILAILAGIATIGLGVFVQAEQFVLLGIAMLVLGVTPLIPVAVKQLAEEG